MDIDKYDRELQLDILTVLYNCAPNSLDYEEYEKLSEKFNNDDHCVANMLYLEMHDLIRQPFIKTVTLAGVGYIFNENECSITEKGIDFLLDDGGLSSILKVQTIRVHSDSIKALEELIIKSNENQATKTSLKAKLRELPANTITHLMNELLVKGVMNLPVALQIIQKYLQ